MGCIPESTNEERSAPRHYSRTRQILLLTVVIIAVACVDFLGFTAEGENLKAVLSDLGCRSSGSLGGWPMGQEHRIAFDRPLTDDEIARLAAAMAQCRRRYFAIILRGWDISDVRLDEIRETLFARSKGWVKRGRAGKANER
ncbi:MAG TPA: hypothetical protein DD670_21280 [Planctomycetaceae bacterium]|nr:hypothetical protein [Planctomycetaceae bacterium]